MNIVAALAVFAVAAVVLWVVPRAFSGRRAAELGIVASVVALVELARVPIGKPETLWGEVDRSWIPALNARLHLGVDEVSWPLTLLTAFLTLACCLWLWRTDTSPALVALIMIIAAASIGVFVAQDLLLFFIFFELALIPMWFVIARWGESSAAATKFILFTVTGSALLLVGIIVVALKSGSLQIEDVRGTKSLLGAVLIALGLAVKVPLVPLHTWLPDAHGKAPTVGSVLLAGVFLKLGTYGLIRLNVQMLPESTERFAPWIAGLGVLGIVWAGLACLVQDDLKRLVAYSSIGHMGFVALAISTMSLTGIVAAIFGSVAHGLITGLLFFVAGSLKEQYGTTSLTKLGRGLYGRAPWRSVALLFAGLATIGLPGLAGFWGEFLTLRAAYEPASQLPQHFSITLMVIATLGIALSTAYVARFARLLLQGEPTPLEADRDVFKREVLVIVLLVLPIVVLGVLPNLVTTLFPAIGYTP